MPATLTSLSEIEPRHFQEWLDSGVDPDIIRLNVRSYLGNSVYELLLSDAIAQFGGHASQYATAPVKRLFERYKTLTEGGWWCSGLDPLDNWAPMLWGQFKGDNPRIDPEKNKPIKYEVPLKTATRAYFLRVTWKVGYTYAKEHHCENDYAQRVWHAYCAQEPPEQAAAFPDGICPLRRGQGFGGSHTRSSQNQTEGPISLQGWSLDGAFLRGTLPAEFWGTEDSGFWDWVVSTGRPITITEGAKKAGALLTHGHAAIALPGIFSGYRKATEKLIEDLQATCKKGRTVYICFDNDPKESTRRNVNKAMGRMGRLLSLAGCKPHIVTLPGPEKGVDDFIVARGHAALHDEFQRAQPLHQWQTALYSQLTYEPALELDQEKLGSFCFLGDRPKLVGIKSPKGSGKTHALINVVDQASADEQKVLLLTHRVQLGQKICLDVGLNYVTELRSSAEGDYFGYGLCIDSLHPESQARFNADDWQDPIVIVDEAEQVIWHLLHATTEVSKHRIAIFKQFQQIIQQALYSKRGQVILLDADLTDSSINFILKMAGAEQWVKPWILENRFHAPNYRKCYHYPQSKPKAWLSALDAAISQGGKHFIVTQAQKAESKWSARNLETHFLKRNPTLKILRVDSDTIAEQGHPAYGCIKKFNQIMQQYDVVIATPTIETGLSIDVYGYFDAVWGCFWGVSSANSARQALARVRDHCDRHIWAANYGVGAIGNGATSKFSLIQSQTKVAKLNLNQLRQMGWTFDGDEIVTNDVALNTWAEMACRINAEMVDYRTAILKGLKAEGYEIISQNTPENIAVYAELEKICAEQTQAEYQETIAQELICDTKGEELKAKKEKSKAERQQLKKWQLHKKYGVEITPKLMALDNDGWHPQIRLHYLFTVGQAFAKHREQQSASSSVHNNEVWYPTFNRGQVSARLKFLEAVRYQDLSKDGELYSADHSAVQHAIDVCFRDPWAVKAIAGFTVKPDDSPISIIQKIHRMVGVKLQYAGRPGSRGNRRRVYQYCAPMDGRDEVFEVWLQRDREAQLNQEQREAEALAWAA